MSESFESLAASPDIIRLATPLLFGSLFSWALYGVLGVQLYVYSYNFPDDRRSLTFIVYIVFLLETIQTALIGTDVHYWFIAGFGKVEHLENSHFGPIDISILSAVIALIVQGYFCYRIRTLARDRWTSWICWIAAGAALIQMVTAMWSGIKSLTVGGEYVNTKTALYLWSISSILANILIAVGMALLRRNTSGKFSSFVLTRVVQFTIETNALTACLAVIILVLYAACPNKLYYIALTATIGKVYSNTLLVSLNNRIQFREHGQPEHGNSNFLKTSDRARAAARQPPRFPISEPQPRTPIGDNIQLCTITQRVELDKGKGDDTSINSSPSCPRKCRLLPDELEPTVDKFRPAHRR